MERTEYRRKFVARRFLCTLEIEECWGRTDIKLFRIPARGLWVAITAQMAGGRS
jgi:hypothetical protein